MKNVGLAAIVLAPIFGLLAAGANYYVLTKKPAETEYLAAKVDIKFGEIITAANLVSIGLPSSLTLSGVKKDDAGLVLDQIASRDYPKGDLLLRRDFDAQRRKLELKEGEEGLRLIVPTLQLPATRVQIEDEISFVISDPETQSVPRKIGPFRVVGINELSDTPSAALTRVVKEDFLQSLTLAVRVDAKGGFPQNVADLLLANQDGRVLAPLLRN